MRTISNAISSLPLIVLCIILMATELSAQWNAFQPITPL